MARKLIIVALVNIGFAVAMAVLTRAVAPLIAGKQMAAIGAEFPGWISSITILLTNFHILVILSLGIVAAASVLFGGAASKRDPSLPLLCGIAFILTGGAIAVYVSLIQSHTGVHEGGWEVPAIWGVAVTITAPISVLVSERIGRDGA